MREQDHGISTIESSALFKLLPYIVRSRDNGAIRALTGAWADSRNRLASAVAEMAKSYDPLVAAAFSPTALGESESLYREYLALARSAVRTVAEEARYQLLRENIPGSVAAYARERDALFAIAGSTGESLAMIALGLNARGALQTAIPRQHIKGSHSALNATGMVIGLFDIKASDLWSRYSLRNPTDPASTANNPDFAYTPDQYPLVSPTQYPRGSVGYDPTVLDDYPYFYEAVYQHCTTAQTSPFRYNAQINGKNPFGYFPEAVTDQLVIGTYQLSGGGPNTRAFVQIPSVGASSYVFESTTYGAHGNQVRMTITLDQFGSQTLKIRGPQSLIKFKTSLFDLNMAVDFERLALYFPPILVRENTSASYLDQIVSRTAPDYPITSVGASPQISSPDGDSPNYQVDMGTYLEVLAVARRLVEASRPLTRTVRREFNGFSLRDQVKYAPVKVISDVVLGGGNKLWRLSAVAGLARFDEVETGDVTRIYQRDLRTGIAYQWAVSPLGTWQPKPITNAEFATKPRVIVMLGQTRVFIESSHLLAKIPETAFQDEIHADPVTESTLQADYARVVENPASILTPYMSVSAVSADEPENLVFQASPEDELTILPTLIDFSSTHLDPHASTEEDSGAGGGNWHYTASGQLVGTDVRLRSVGIHGGLIEPVPTGILTYGYPVSFLNYHNTVVWRNRLTNAPFSGSYTYASVDELHGATLTAVALGTDGPIEGSSVVAIGSSDEVPTVGDGVTPNQQIPTGFAIDLLVLTRMERRYDAHTSYYSVTSGTGGNARINFRTSQDFQVGNKIHLPESSAYAGVRSVLAVSSDWVEISAEFSTTELGSFTKLIGEMLVMAAQDITIEIKKDTNLGPSTLGVFQRQPGSQTYLAIDVFSLTEHEGSFTVSVSEAHEVLFFGSGRSSFRLRVLAPDNSLQGLPGTLTALGNRVDVALTLLSADGERFWTYDAGGSQDIEIDSVTTWRGGQWPGDSSYESDNSDRVAMPGVLTRSIQISPSAIGILGVDLSMTPITFTVDVSGVALWDISFGTLPAGLSLSSGGILSGTPTEEGSFTFGLHAHTDFGEATIAITLTVGNMTLSPASLEVAELGAAYLADLTVSGGTAPYTLTLDGSLPSGFSWTQVGDDVFRITGTADPDTTQMDDYNFSVDIEDALGGLDTRALTLTVGGPVVPAFSAPSGVFTMTVDS